MIRALALVVLLAVAGCGSPQPGAAPRTDPLAMVGWWRVDDTDQVVLLDPSGIEIRDGCRTVEGNWRGDPDGRFVAQIYSGMPCPNERVFRLDGPAWLTGAVGFSAEGADRVLRDPAGVQLARLRPEPAGVVSGAVDPSRPVTDADRQAVATAAPIPAGLRPAGREELVGRWLHDGFTRTTRPAVEFTAKDAGPDRTVATAARGPGRRTTAGSSPRPGSRR